MSDQPVYTTDNAEAGAEPSEAPRPFFIIVGALAIVALAAELFVGVTSAFAPAISAPSTTQTATPGAPPATSNLTVQVPPAG